MPRVGFESTIPVFERPKTVPASDRSAVETGQNVSKAEQKESTFWKNASGVTNTK